VLAVLASICLPRLDGNLLLSFAAADYLRNDLSTFSGKAFAQAEYTELKALKDRYKAGTLTPQDNEVLQRLSGNLGCLLALHSRSEPIVR
jgi:hypothetical protein